MLRGNLHVSKGGDIWPYTQLVWSVTKLIVKFGCQCDKYSWFISSAFYNEYEYKYLYFHIYIKWTTKYTHLNFFFTCSSFTS